MNYIYHRVPKEMRGEVLFPLNTLKETEPDLYEKESAKYVGRDVGTISRELKRNRTRQYKQYMPVMAQAIAGTRTHRQRTAAPLKKSD